jgi:cytochrome b561
MTRRSVVIFLHWSMVLLLLAMVKGGTSNINVLRAFAGIVVIWEAITLAKGLLGRPGPKLSPTVQRAYPWMHRLLHILLSLTAVAIIGRLLGHPIPFLDAWTMLLVTLGAGTAHGVFHFWRHTALYDNALRLILPKFMHSIL